MTIESLYQLYKDSSGVCTDNRKVKDGNIFFALTGERFNGNKFAEEAIQNGCSYAVIDDPEYKIDDRFLLVSDVLRTLQDLAHFHRKQLNASVIAITGSNGKTTCKELSFAVLSSEKNVFATPGNFNNHIGLPLTLLQTPTDTEVLLLEMGDSKIGDVEELCEIAEPDLGYITNIGKDHIGGFGSMENNIRAKAEIFDYLAANGKPCLVQEDELVKSILPKGAETITLPFKALELGSVDLAESESPLIAYSTGKETHQTALVGAYNLHNISFAVSLGRYFNVSESNIHRAISNYAPSNNRSQLEETERGNTLIMDAYNANPSSVDEAVKSLGELNSSKSKGVILGDMLELGSISEAEHAGIVQAVIEQNFGFAIFIGALFNEHKQENGLFFATKKELESYLNEHPISDSLILLKGSRGMALETLKHLL